MLIRPVQPADFPAIARLTNYFIEHTAIHFGMVPVLPSELEESWNATRDRHPFLVAMLSREGGEPEFAGFARCYTWRTREAYLATAECGIYLESWARGRGMGRRLYEALFEAARAAGLHTLVAGIAVPNPESIALHERCGFIHKGTFQEVGRKFNAWHDVAFYQRSL